MKNSDFGGTFRIGQANTYHIDHVDWKYLSL